MAGAEVKGRAADAPSSHVTAGPEGPEFGLH